MIHVAKEMERTGFKVPLLIGGATTSKLVYSVVPQSNKRYCDVYKNYIIIISSLYHKALVIYFYFKNYQMFSHYDLFIYRVQNIFTF